jgi:hypothetical protein
VCVWGGGCVEWVTQGKAHVSALPRGNNADVCCMLVAGEENG